MTYKLIDYKGKHYIIQDEAVDNMDFAVGEVEDKDLTDAFLKSHVDACTYYGIPPYIGKNKELNGRIEKMYLD